MTAEAPPFDEATLDDDERKIYAMLRQIVQEALVPLFEERWPDFEKALTEFMRVEVNRLLALESAKDDALPQQMADSALKVMTPLLKRLQRVEAVLFRRGLG